MDTPAIQEMVNRLAADRESVPWSERASMVRRLLGKTGRVRPLAAPATVLLGMLAEDPKWEVRKEVADQIHRLGDSDFAGIAAVLSRDDNAFVKSAAERAMDRRRSGRNHSAKRVRGLDRIEDELRRIEVKHGENVANMIRDTAQRLYEGLVGASVHEMRSVVTAMKTNIENLARCRDDEAGEVARKVAVRLADRVSYLERLLDDMKDYTRATSRERASESVTELVSEALEMVHAEFAARGRDATVVEPRLDVPADLIVRVSRMPVVLALRNLLKNAHEAFMVDEVSFAAGTVHVEACSTENGVRITIRDDGMGMSGDELASVLQFIPGRSSKGSLGTGFGLPIARRHIAAHDGELLIQSQEDRGTVVTVHLPTGGRRNA